MQSCNITLHTCICTALPRFSQDGQTTLLLLDGRRLGSSGLCSRNHGIMLSWMLALCLQNPHIMLPHAGILIHFVVRMEPQSSENCAFFVLASGLSATKYMSTVCIPIPRCPCMLEVNIEKRKQYFFYSALVDFFCKLIFHCQTSLSYL